MHSKIGMYGLVLTGEVGGVSLKLFINFTRLLVSHTSVISISPLEIRPKKIQHHV